jgi:glycosyltransferase involved in cell wall biosynthesis
MKNKKLVLLTQYFPPEMGAPQSRLWEAASGLQRNGWEVSVITAMPNYPTGKIFKGYKGKFFRKEEKEGIKISRYWLYPSNSRNTLPRVISMLSFSFTALFAALKLLFYRPAIIIVESPPLTLAFSAWILSKFGGSKLVMNVSDLWPLSAYELGSISKGKMYFFLEKLEKFLYDRSDACLGQSRQITDYIKEVSPVKTHLFRNGVDVKRFHGGSDDVGQSFQIVYAGLLGVAQGILELCKTIDFHALGYEFHIYGEGPERLQLERFLSTNRNRGIQYYGTVAREQVPNMLLQYDIALIPLVKPIFGAVPSKIYEAMAAGLPIIFMGGGEGENMIREHKAGWICEPSDYKSLQARLKEIEKISPEQMKEMKIHCRHLAQNIFDREIQIGQLDLFLKEI